MLSDGKDESSRFSYEDALEYARRAGVAIYTIGLEYKKADRADKKRLSGWLGRPAVGASSSTRPRSSGSTRRSRRSCARATTSPTNRPIRATARTFAPSRSAWSGPDWKPRPCAGIIPRVRPPHNLVLVLALLQAPPPLASSEVPPLAERHARWLEEAAILLSPQERDEFETLREDYRRDAFIELFWNARDPHPATARNEFRDRWEERLAAARQHFGTLRDIRAQVYLLVGEPVVRLRPGCPDLLLPSEIWSLDDKLAAPAGGGTVVFVKSSVGQGAYQAWNPAEELSALGVTSDENLADRVRRRCDDGEVLLLMLSRALPLDRLRELTLPPTDDEWLATFRQRSTEIDRAARSLDAELQISYPGRSGSRTIVEATVSVPRHALAETGDSESYDFVLDGEILRAGALLETFRYRFEPPAEVAPDEPLPLVVQRHLRPGSYSLRLRVESLDTQRFFRASRELEVPIVSASTSGSGTASGAHSVTLMPPPGGLHTGRLRVEARTTGDDIAAVAFELNGRRLMSKRRPPWSIEVDLGRAPRIHELRALAVDPEGGALASDRIYINAGPQHFEVRLVEPESGTRHAGSLQARAVVDVPRGAHLDRLEFHLNETLLSTLYQPPFVQTLRLPDSAAMAYVRAVAYLDDGHSSESLVFINSPTHHDRVDIDLVELYTTVVDRKGRPVEGLVQEDFSVYEEKVPQEIRRFEHASDLSFHAAVVLDTSTSMAEELRQAEKAALSFFRNIVTPRDRAAVVTFADEPRLVVPFTADLEVLAGGLAGVAAEGETALHDSIIFTLYHFGGLKGQRALILLSDGEDSLSRYSFEETLEFARETGVAVFAIGLDIPSRAHEARSKLMRLCNETGGRYFFIHRTAELDRVYGSIERELRSQYLIAYQSSQEGDSFRRIDVRLSNPALRAKTIAGYNP